MDKVMMIAGGEYYYWKPVILAIAALSAALMAVALRLRRGEKLLPLLVALPLGGALSVFFARFIHWYCRFESYDSLGAALRHLRGGGYSLIGVFIGMLLAFLIVRLLRLTDDLPALLDCAAPAAALGIAVGRFGDLLTTADRGKMILENEALRRLPYAAAVRNATSGAVEWRVATFCAQSIWAAVIFAILLLWMLLPRRRRMKQARWEDGNVFLLFMTLYCSGQIVTDSTRYDALFLRSNGFVSLEQIVCGVSVAAVLALLSARSIRTNGFRFRQVLLWLLFLAGLGLAGFMEYYVQRHGNEFVFAYGMMAEGLLISFCAVYATWLETTTLPPRKNMRSN